MKEIKIIENDGYECNIDELKSITIKNKLGMSFEYNPDEIKSIELLDLTASSTASGGK